MDRLAEIERAEATLPPDTRGFEPDGLAMLRDDVKWLIARVRELERSQRAEFEAAEQGLQRAEEAEKHIAELEAELKAMTALSNQVTPLSLKLYEAENALHNLEADKARLDWLERRGISIYWCNGRVSWCAIRYDETSDADWPYQVMYSHGSFKNVVDWAMAHPKELEMIVENHSSKNKP